MGKKKGIEVRKLTKDIYVVDYDTIYTQRKKTLISRDPLAKDLLKKLDEYRPNKSNPSEKEIESLRQKLEDRWNVSILITSAAKPFVTGLPVIVNQTRDNCLSPVKFSYDGITIEEGEPLIISNKIAGNPITSFHPPMEGMLFEAKTHELVLHVNLSILDNADARTIKSALWNIIKEYIPKNKSVSKTVDIPEISFIYDIRQNTFENYIRWYDLHMEKYNQRSECFSFRSIAFCEYVLRKNPEQYEETKRRVADRTKVVKSTGGERVYKGVIGDNIKGEDAVEKGVKVIYNAIHREPYPSKKTNLKEYNCPTHGLSCPTKECAYLQLFMKNFNKATMLFKPLHTTDPAALTIEQLPHSKRKPTADQQFNTDKTL